MKLFMGETPEPNPANMLAVIPQGYKVRSGIRDRIPLGTNCLARPHFIAFLWLFQDRYTRIAERTLLRPGLLPADTEASLPRSRPLIILAVTK